jgi:hypothetical protein
MEGLRRSIERGAVVADHGQGSNGNGSRFKLSPQTAMTIIGYVIAVLLAWGAANARLSVLENRVNNADSRMQRMEDKLDRIWERVK